MLNGMTGPGVGWPRGVRAAALTAVSVGLAGVGHTVVGRMPLPPAGVLLALLLLAPLTWAATGRRLRFGRLVALLAAGQAIAHVTFAIANGIVATMSAPPGMARMTQTPGTLAPVPGITVPGMTDSGMTDSGLTMPSVGHVMGAMPGMSAPAASSPMGLLPSGRMLLGHLAATLLLSAVLAWGERIIWQVRRLLPQWVTIARFPVTGPRPAAGGERTAYVPGVCGSARLTRGPPSVAAV